MSRGLDRDIASEQTRDRNDGGERDLPRGGRGAAKNRPRERAVLDLQDVLVQQLDLPRTQTREHVAGAFRVVELLREFGNEGELRDRIVLTSFQRPGKSEGRTLADFTKANSLRQATPRGFIGALGRNRAMPASPIMLCVDDWVGSGEQIGNLLQQNKSKFVALAKDVSSRGGRLAFRVLLVACYEPAARDIDAFFSQHGLDGRTIIARRVTPADRSVGSESEVIPNAQARGAFEAFAQDMGRRLWAEYPLGWPPGALLVAFPHDVPNNSLPLLWKNSRWPRWRPLISGVSRSRGRPS
jgi:hypothetical protein